MQHTTPPPIQPRPVKKSSRNCLVGCLVGIVLALGLVMIGSFGAYYFIVRIIDDYTSETPAELPEVRLTAEETNEVVSRVTQFAAGLDGQADVWSLRLTGEEINALLMRYERQAGPIGKHMRISIDEGEITADMSMPLSELGLGTRYFNGSASLDVGLEDTHFYVFLKELQIGERTIPETLLAELSNQNLANAILSENPEWAGYLRRLEAVYAEGNELVFIRKEGESP